MLIFVQLALSRWLNFVSVMILFGSSLFPLYAGTREVRTIAAKSHVALALLALGSALAWAAYSLVEITGDPSSVFDAQSLNAFFFETPFGKAWLVRFALLIATLVLTIFAWGRRSQPVWPTTVITLCSGALLVSQAWLGHAGSGVGALGWAQIAVYAVHVLAAGAWLGGLVPLGWLLTRSGAVAPVDGQMRLCLALQRFSAMGIIAVILILATGVANSVFRLTSPAALVTTPYGLIICTKVLLLSLMIVLAAVNRLRLVPAFCQKSGFALDRYRAALTRNVVAELAIGALVLVAASVLGMLSPYG